METIKIKRYIFPAGEMLLGSYEDKLCVCDWEDSCRRSANDRRIRRHLNAVYEEGDSETILLAINQLEKYFSGNWQDFSIPVIFTGTDFQCRVWSELMKIPYGTTISYSTVAQRIGNPKAVRAVAAAIAANPVSIIVPCHRVIGSDNKLTGYAGGLPAKKFLLNLEADKTINNLNQWTS